VLIAAGRARQHHKKFKGQHKERDHRSGSGGFSEYFEAFTLFMNDDAPCGSKPAWWRCRIFFTKGCMRHGIPEYSLARQFLLKGGTALEYTHQAK
jgi:hypothetical protein